MGTSGLKGEVGHSYNQKTNVTVPGGSADWETYRKDLVQESHSGWASCRMRLAYRETGETPSWTRLKVESGRAGEEDGGANFSAPWSFGGSLHTLPHALGAFCIPSTSLSPQQPLWGRRVWRGLEKEAPSTLVKPDGGRRGGSRAGQGRERGAGPAAGTC